MSGLAGGETHARPGIAVQGSGFATGIIGEVAYALTRVLELQRGLEFLLKMIWPYRMEYGAQYGVQSIRYGMTKT